MKQRIPTYSETAIHELPKGLYLGLFHGRDTVDEEMPDWGYQGPVIGPLKYVHTTYAASLKYEFVDKVRGKMYEDAGVVEDAEEGEIPITKDAMVFCNGKYYGDWTVYHSEGEPAMTVDLFQKITDFLLGRHYGINLNDTPLCEPEVVQVCLDEGEHPYEVINRHANDTELERVDIDSMIPSKRPLTEEDEDYAVRKVNERMQAMVTG